MIDWIRLSPHSLDSSCDHESLNISVCLSCSSVQYWRMNLRGFGAYFVCVGNIFSGLYVPVMADDRRKPTVFVRRPQPRQGAAGASDATTMTSAAALPAGTTGSPTAAEGLGLTGLVSAQVIAKEQPSRAATRRPWTRGSEFTLRRQRQLGPRMGQLQRGANLVSGTLLNRLACFGGVVLGKSMMNLG